MPIPSRATLKSYFETGDTPTQAQFEAMIDAMYDMAQQSLDDAEDALAIVQANSLKAFGYLKIARVAGGPAPGAPAPTDTIYRTAGCAVAVGHVLSALGGPPLYSTRIVTTITVTLNTPNADAHYYASCVATPTETNGAGTLTALSTKVVSKTDTVVVFEVTVEFQAASGGEAFVQFQVFP